MIDFYDVLGIDSDASQEEVKRVYRMKLKQYPPETHPDEFRKIREAYETLSNEKTRAEYDAMSKYGDEIAALLDQGREWMKQEEYDKAADCFKKVLVYEPSIAAARNLYGLMLAYQDEHEKAIAQFKKLIQSDGKNVTYLYNMAVSLKELERYDEALMFLARAKRIDQDIIDTVLLESSIYEKMKQLDEAKDAIEQAIRQLPTHDFRIFSLLFRLVKIDLFDRNENGMNRTFARIDELLLHHEDEKKYVSHQFASFAFDLYQIKLYELANHLTDRATKLTPDAEHIRNLHDEVTRKKPIYNEYEILKDDEQITETVKKVYTLLLYGDTVDEQELEKLQRFVFDELFQLSKIQPDRFKHSVNRMVVNYPALYELNKDLWQELNRRVKLYVEVQEQFQRMSDDSRFSRPLKALIVLDMLPPESEYERKQKVELIFENLAHESDATLRYSLQMLHGDYKACRKLYEDLFNKLDREYHVYGPPPRQSSSVNRPSHQTYQPPAKSNDSSCFVATVAYGTPLADELDVLRAWRDQRLRQTWLGKKFIRMYYRYGERLAAWVGKSERLKACCRWMIRLIVERVAKGVNID